MNYPFAFPLETRTIRAERAAILVSLCNTDPGFRSDKVESIRQNTLDAMRDAYDRQFFSGYLHRRYPELPVSISMRMTSAAGKFVYPRKQLIRHALKGEIRMSGDFLFRLKQGPFQLNGLTAETPQEAFLIVFEHELIHALEFALYGKTGHSDRFLYLAGGLFGHTSIYHQLPTRSQEAGQLGLIPGMLVSFEYHERVLDGRIRRIGKTATVMVPDLLGLYVDNRGQRYSKYSVPLHKLLINEKKIT